MKLFDTKLPEHACLSCGALNDAATYVGNDPNAKPKPDDITICFDCGHVMAFTNDLGMRELNDAEMHEIAGNKIILAIQDARGKARAKET